MIVNTTSMLNSAYGDVWEMEILVNFTNILTGTNYVNYFNSLYGQSWLYWPGMSIYFPNTIFFFTQML